MNLFQLIEYVDNYTLRKMLTKQLLNILIDSETRMTNTILGCWFDIVLPGKSRSFRVVDYFFSDNQSKCTLYLSEHKQTHVIDLSLFENSIVSSKYLGHSL